MRELARAGLLGALCLGGAASAWAAGIEVSEAATRLRLAAESFQADLVVNNPSGLTLKATISAELLDPDDNVRSRGSREETLAAGMQVVVLELRPGTSELSSGERRHLLHQRLRYRIELQSPPPSVPRVLSGTLSVSRITPDLFELRLLGGGEVPAGRPLDVMVQAAHPVTSTPVAGVELTAGLRLDGPETAEIHASATTNGQGLAILHFDLASGRQREDGSVVVTGERAGLSVVVSTAVRIRKEAQILVSTDKPLYQPGQVLHIRALARYQGGGKAVARLPLELKVRDRDMDTIFETRVETSRFGVATLDWPIPEHASLGDWFVEVSAHEDETGLWASGGTPFRLSRYELPQYSVRVSPDRSYYLPDQTPEVEVRADYLFGQPVTRGRVRVVLEGKPEWNSETKRYDVEERAVREGFLSASGVFSTRLELDEDDFPDDDLRWEKFKDVDGVAYVTDSTTGRTEARRFVLRASRESIHVYVFERHAEVCPGKSDRICHLSLYVSTSYADGTPASCEVKVGQRPRADNDDNNDDNSDAFASERHLTTVRTNRYGVARVVDLRLDAEAPDANDEEVQLRLVARDATGRSGTLDDEVGGWRAKSLLLESPRIVHAPGVPVEVRITSHTKRGPYFVELTSTEGTLASRLVRLRGSPVTVRFPYDSRFVGPLAVVVTQARERNPESSTLGIVYPAAGGLRVDVRPDRAEYRPGESGSLRFDMRSDDGRPAPGVLGVVVVDRAVEERAANEPRMLANTGFLGPFRAGGSLGGITIQDLMSLDTSRPLPEGFELIAEVLLAQSAHAWRRVDSSDEYDGDTGAAFADRFSSDLLAVASALRARFAEGERHPESAVAALAALAQAKVDFGILHDPWSRAYRIQVVPRGSLMVLEVRSAGPDRLAGTSDDLTALTLQWPYFAPQGRVLQQAAQSYYDRAESVILSVDALRAELGRAGQNLDEWRDPWGHAYRYSFRIEGVYGLITVTSSGPDGVADGPNGRRPDDVNVFKAKVDGYGRARSRLKAAVDSLYTETGRFPQAREEWTEVLARAGIAEVQDLWGRPTRVEFHIEDSYATRVTVRSYAELRFDRRKRVEATPVTRRYDVLSLVSAGADGKEGTGDDVELAYFRRALVELRSVTESLRLGAEASPVLERGVGAIQGTIVDSSGAVVPGVTVTIRDAVRGQTVSTQSNATGVYSLAGLAPGFWVVRFELAGFKPSVVTDVPVEAGGTTALSIELQVGDISEVVAVAAESLALSTATGALEAVLVRPVGTSASQSADRLSTPRVRREFPETLLWQPALETDAQGRASLPIRLADSLTTWRVSVIASTEAGQLATTERDLLVFQPFFVENDPPPILTEGDALELPALVRNYTATAVDAVLSAEARDGLTLEGPAQQSVRIPKGDAARAVFGLRAPVPTPKGLLTVTGRTSDAADAVEKPVLVHPDGAETATSVGDLLTGPGVLHLIVPEKAIPGSIRAEVRLGPNLGSLVLESVEAVMRRPSGCAEQTISSTYPSVMALRLLEKGASDEPLAVRARRYVELGYERLLGFQQADGSFGYFRGGEANLALTAYALRFMQDARDFSRFDQDAFGRARAYLLSKQAPDGRWPMVYSWKREEHRPLTLGLTAAVARALVGVADPETKTGLAGPQPAGVRSALERALVYLKTASEERLDPYVLACAALVAQALGSDSVSKEALERLRPLAHTESTGVYWADEQNTPFLGWGRAGRLETTALVVRALSVSQNPRDLALVHQGLRFLLRNRDRYGVWWSGQATVNVLDALIGEIGPLTRGEGTVPARVTVNGKLAGALDVPRDGRMQSLLPLDLTAHVVPGPNRIEIVRGGDGEMSSVQATATAYVRWPDADLRASDSLSLDVTADRTEVRIGEAIELKAEAERVGFRGYGMLLAEVGLPPGVDVDRESLDAVVADGSSRVSFYEIQPDRVVLYIWSGAGKAVCRFRVRPRFAMTAQSAASTLYDYYNSEASVTRPPLRFVVRE